MKRFRLLTCFLIFILLALAACGEEMQLDAPEGVTVEYETLTLKWDEVKGAKIYTVRIESDREEPMFFELSKNYYSLDSLPAGEYSLSVRVGGKDSEESQFSEAVSFIRDEEIGLEFRLIGGREYEVVSKGEATGVVRIPATYRQKPVTSIGEKAFFNASDVTEVILPNTVKSIGAFAFANCSYLEKIELPYSLVSMGESAFSGCRAIGGTLTLPEGLTEIPNGAFAYCSSIEEIKFGENVVSIGNNAFTDLSDLKAIILPASLEQIGNFAFAACADVGEIRFEEGLTEIGEFAFSKAVSLNSVTLPNSLKVLGKGAFYHSSQLSEVRLGENIEEIGDAAFLETGVYNDSVTNEIYVGDWFIALKDITVSVVQIREGTVGVANSGLYANQYVTAIELPDSVRYIGKNAFAGSNIVSVVTGSGVVRVDDQAFLYCDKLIDVVLGSYDYVEQTIKESSLVSIGDYAFMNCSKLSRIQIPESVTEIGAYAFRNTDMYHSALSGAVYADNWIVDYNKTVTEDIVVDKGTVGIAQYAFYGLSELKTIKIDNSVRYIGKGAFYNCTALEKVTFPDTLARIEDYTFYNCSSLKLTSLPPMLRTIGRSAFYMCGVADNYIDDSDDDRLEIPSGVTHIGDYAFFGCGFRRADSISGKTETAGIDTIVMGDKLEYVGKGAFREFASLKTVIIGGVASIGERAFYGCDSLEEVRVDGGLITIGDKAFYRCGSLCKVTLPDTLIEIGNYSFYKCEKLTSVNLGGALEKIGNYAFYGNTLLSEIDLPVTLLHIGENAFRDCESLGSLALGEKILYVGPHAFYSCDNLTLYLDGDADSKEWHENWNSTFVPVVVGCDVSNGGYLISVSGDTIINHFGDTVISAPTRAGHVFTGWSKSASSEKPEYSMEYLYDSERDGVLYAVWKTSEAN